MTTIVFTKDVYAKDKKVGDKPLYASGSQYEVTPSVAAHWVGKGSARHGLHEDHKTTPKPSLEKKVVKMDDIDTPTVYPVKKKKVIND